MDNLLKEIRRVQRRLALQYFLGILGWCWFASLLAAAGVVAAARIWPLGAVTGIRDWHWLAGFLVAGLVAAVAWTLFKATPAIQAALEIDRRCGLKERISSTLAMRPDDRRSEAGQALVADADARLRRVAVLEQFPVRPTRFLLLPLAPAAVVAAAMIFWLPAQVKAVVDKQNADTQTPIEVKRSADDLGQKLAQLRKKTEDNKELKDATDILKKLEEGAHELQAQPDREKALVKINDLARQLEQRRKQLGGDSEKFWRQMEKVQGIDQGPADKLAKALSKGDFAKAAQELEKLQKELSGNKLDPAKKDELAKQVEQLKQKLDQMAQQNKDAQADLQKRADQLRQSGDNAAASKLEDEIQKLQQQGPQMDMLKNLSNALGQCANQMKQGKGDQAAQAMQDAVQQMQDMAKQQGEMKTLDAAMDQLSDARRQMNCDKCGGKGCKECQGQGEAEMAEMGNGDGDKNGKPGMGLGKGRGDGARPEAKADGKFYDSRVSQKVGKGGGQITGTTGGANLKNQAEAEIQKATTEVEHGRTDPLSGMRLPKKQSENAREYFDSFREGK